MIFMKKNLLFLLFILIGSFIFPETLPQPKNMQLYTDFKAEKKAVFLKKPLISSGYIVINGKNNFIFKQIIPFSLEVRKKDNKLTYKKDKMDPVELPESASGDNIAFLFEGDESILANYNITKKFENSLDYFTIIPKQIGKIKEILVSAKEDKLITIKLNFTDKSSIFYTFQNTVTGIAPDEKYFY